VVSDISVMSLLRVCFPLVWKDETRDTKQCLPGDDVGHAIQFKHGAYVPDFALVKKILSSPLCVIHSISLIQVSLSSPQIAALLRCITHSNRSVERLEIIDCGLESSPASGTLLGITVGSNIAKGLHELLLRNKTLSHLKFVEPRFKEDHLLVPALEWNTTIQDIQGLDIPNQKEILERNRQFLVQFVLHKVLTGNDFSEHQKPMVVSLVMDFMGLDSAIFAKSRRLSFSSHIQQIMDAQLWLKRQN
jgi:hypothetical protein